MQSIPDGPAIGVLELCSIARGVRTTDAMLKRAPVSLRQAGSTHPGKYLVFVSGGVDEVFEALAAGEAVAAESLIGRLFLPNPHESLLRVLEGPQELPLRALAILESFSVAATLRGADAALKAADVEALRLGLARDLGGKGYFALTGELHDVEEAVKAGCAAIGEGLLAGCDIVARPHAELLAALR